MCWTPNFDAVRDETILTQRFRPLLSLLIHTSMQCTRVAVLDHSFVSTPSPHGWSSNRIEIPVRAGSNTRRIVATATNVPRLWPLQASFRSDSHEVLYKSAFSKCPSLQHADLMLSPVCSRIHLAGSDFALSTAVQLILAVGQARPTYGEESAGMQSFRGGVSEPLAVAFAAPTALHGFAHCQHRCQHRSAGSSKAPVEDSDLEAPLCAAPRGRCAVEALPTSARESWGRGHRRPRIQRILSDDRWTLSLQIELFQNQPPPTPTCYLGLRREL